MNQRFRSAIERKAQRTPPIWFMRQAGRYHSHYQNLRQRHSFEQLCKQPQLAAEVARGPVAEFDFDVAILFSDILFPLEGLGTGLKYTDQGPELGIHLDSKNIQNLSSPSEAIEFLKFQGLALKETRKVLASDKSLIGFVGGLWTLFVYAVEGAHSGSLIQSKLDPKLFHQFMEILLPVIHANIQNQLDSGAEIVMIFDTAAGELSSQQFKNEVSGYLTQLAKMFPNQLGYYSRGTQPDFFDVNMLNAPWVGIGVDHRWNLATAFNLRTSGFTQGNFDQSLLFQEPSIFRPNCGKIFARCETVARELKAILGVRVGARSIAENAGRKHKILYSSCAGGVLMKTWSQILAKYDVPVPRYTSYPTVPYWSESPTTDQWLNHLRRNLGPDKSWSMYLHVPFCETLCTFCGCNNIITKDHKKEDRYVEMVNKEWELYQQLVSELNQSVFRHLHLGGGTPTFLSPAALRKLLEPILSKVKIVKKGFEASIEVDPRRTSKEQLSTLRELGFNRVSMGIQDFNPEVQRLVNRHQPFEVTASLTEAARSLGYESVNFDLIYGLAKQTPEGIKDSVKKTLQLRPDRIALYSFALVPWIKPAQRLFKDEDLPKASEKRDLYEIAREYLLAGGYIEVGMDHFALPTDNLALALKSKTLHRNFMGYTDQRTDVMLGLGVSSISETPESFFQNEKLLPKYESALAAGNIPGLRGHILNQEDRQRRQQILKLMTEFEVTFESPEQQKSATEFLHEMVNDGLVKISADKMIVTESGRPFLRMPAYFLMKD